MRILYFHQHYTSPAGGGGTRSYEFARRLVALGHQVTMVCGRYGTGVTGLEGDFRFGVRSGCVEGIDIIEMDLPYGNHQKFLLRTWVFLRYSLRSVWLALSMKYDLVFATSTPLTAGIPGVFAKIFRRKPFVFEVRDLWPELPKAMGVITNPVILSLMSALEWITCRTADHCIGLAPGIAEGIRRLNVDASRVSMIPNGCDIQVFGGSSAPEIPGIGPEDFVAVFAGSHGVANGLDALLDVAEVLKQRQQNHIRILFVGDGKMKPSLMERARRDGLDNCVFLPTMPKYDVAGLYRRADVGLMILSNVPAFYFGTSPNKFFDYIASGLPVICNYPGWLSDLISTSDCGFAVSPTDAGEFADRLETLSRDPARRKQCGEHAARLSQSFDRDKLAAEFVRVLESVACKGEYRVSEVG